MACLSLLLDQKVFNNIASAFMAYEKKWAFLSHLGFIIIGSPICYALYAILILLLNKVTGRWVAFLVKRAYVLAHEVVLYVTKDIILAHLVFSFHGCYFICFMKFMTPQDTMQLIKVCTLEFARSALRFSFHGKWMSASFFLFTAFIGFLAMVSGFSSISFSSFYLCCIYGLGFCLFCFLSETEVWNHYFFPKVNFNLMENLPNAAGEVADNIADHSGWLNMIPVCVSSYHKVRSLKTFLWCGLVFSNWHYSEQ